MCFLEHLIHHVPNLEKLSVVCTHLQRDEVRRLDVEAFRASDEGWIHKVPKLKYFMLKSGIDDATELNHLKWLLNNLRHISKLRIYLKYRVEWLRNSHSNISNTIDTNFIRQYCLPGILSNLKDFYLYIGQPFATSTIEMERINDEFTNNLLFLNGQYIKFQVIHDQKRSYQHIFSSNLDQSQFLAQSLVEQNRYECSDIQNIRFDLDQSFCRDLKQFSKSSLNISSISVRPVTTGIEPIPLQPLLSAFETTINNLDVKLRNVTILRFGFCNVFMLHPCHQLSHSIKTYVTILAHLVSIPNQLRSLFIAKFEWLLYLFQYAADKLRKNALNTVRCIEFGLASCNYGSNESIGLGANLVPVLSTYMPHLRILRLWRLDDFPWTSLRRKYIKQRNYAMFMHKWRLFLKTAECANEHTIVFEQNLCQLHDQLKELLFLDIYGVISDMKVESYRQMVQTRFPSCRVYVKTSRFCLWF
ncbi:unnamed protein product [Adineta ricciae]|uniref:F-box domain-containing protein n=1 Tax=Adineta ricciae TaxID=249248 RepID=A0A814ZKA2_ADIRI|nr:unnamed protein product [Adineta ricciae]